MKKTIIKNIFITVLAFAISLAFVGCAKTQECKICQKSFEPAEHNAHTTVGGTVYICDDCENAATETTNAPESETTDTETELELELGPQECRICKETFEAKKPNAHPSADGVVYICDNCENTAKE